MFIQFDWVIALYPEFALWTPGADQCTPIRSRWTAASCKFWLGWRTASAACDLMLGR